MIKASSAIWENIDVRSNYDFINRTAEEFPKNAMYQIMKADAEILLKGRIEQADADLLHRILAISPFDAAANRLLMRYYLSEGEIDLAKVHFDAIPSSRLTTEVIAQYAGGLDWWEPKGMLWKTYAAGYKLYMALADQFEIHSDVKSITAFNFYLFGTGFICSICFVIRSGSVQRLNPFIPGRITSRQPDTRLSRSAESAEIS